MKTPFDNMSLSEIEYCVRHLRHEVSLLGVKKFKTRGGAVRCAAEIESLCKLAVCLLAYYCFRSTHNHDFFLKHKRWFTDALENLNEPLEGEKK